MIPLVMVVCDGFTHGPAKRALANEHYPFEAGLLETVADEMPSAAEIAANTVLST